MATLPSHDLHTLLARVRGGEDGAWAEFLAHFAPFILQVTAGFERDPDAARDAFVYACERLKEHHGAKLASYDFHYPGSFEGWLRAVVVNLCRDGRRRRHGRLRPLLGVRRLPALEQRVFGLRYEAGVSFDQTLAMLRCEYPHLTETRLSEAESQISKRLSARDRWLILTRRPRVDSIDSEIDPGAADQLPADTADPEWLALAGETRQALLSALATLTAEERLMLALRFERGVTLARVAVMFRLRDVQTADRRIREILRRLRRHLEGHGV